jgi:ABC-type transport system involved in multi-copper enzyme maturation permease subunit
MKSILKYILKNGLRDRLYLGLFIAIAMAFAVSIFLGTTMLIEQNQSSIVYSLATTRTILSIGMILFVCINLNRAFENKEIEFILSKSISREKFVLAYLAGFFIANFLILLPITTLIYLIFPINKLGLLFWFLTTLSENLIVISFALLSSLILKNSFSAILASFGFYAISRLMGMFVMAIDIPEDYTSVAQGGLASALKILSILFPRLDLFAQSSWGIYGVKDNVVLLIIFFQSIIYLPLMIFMAFHDFKKKQF